MAGLLSWIYIHREDAEGKVRVKMIKTKSPSIEKGFDKLFG
jgi:hypothetical protein